ncbi:hypothetical protein BJY00DRAFT_296797 [Aspergillus carlsbadensis]|nr:hypothetical protein BJY00DRAFT_296797 [Aspergillus carlsbadensis]
MRKERPRGGTVGEGMTCEEGTEKCPTGEGTTEEGRLRKARLRNAEQSKVRLRNKATCHRREHDQTMSRLEEKDYHRSSGVSLRRHPKHRSAHCPPNT